MFQKDVCLSDQTVHPWQKPGIVVYRTQSTVLAGDCQIAPSKFNPYSQILLPFSRRRHWMSQLECLLAELLVKISFQSAFWRLSVSGMIYGMIEKDHFCFCFFSLVDPENLGRAAGAVIQVDFSHTTLAFHAVCTALNCPSALLYLLCQGKGPRTDCKLHPRRVSLCPQPLSESQCPLNKLGYCKTI